MSSKDDLPAKVLLMLAPALEDLQRSEGETDLARIRTLIANVQSVLIELHAAATAASADDT